MAVPKSGGFSAFRSQIKVTSLERLSLTTHLNCPQLFPLDHPALSHWLTICPPLKQEGPWCLSVLFCHKPSAPSTCLTHPGCLQEKYLPLAHSPVDILSHEEIMGHKTCQVLLTCFCFLYLIPCMPMSQTNRKSKVDMGLPPSFASTGGHIDRPSLPIQLGMKRQSHETVEQKVWTLHVEGSKVKF